MGPGWFCFYDGLGWPFAFGLRLTSLRKVVREISEVAFC